MEETAENPETLELRLIRLTARWERSKEVFEDDTRALHLTIQEARGQHSVRWIARAIRKSPGYTHKLMHALVGPTSRDLPPEEPPQGPLGRE